MRIAALLCCVAVTGLAFGQDRVDRILSIADARVGRQIDEWFDKGDFPRAIEGLRYLADRDPSDYEIHTNLGWMYGNVRNEDLEIQTYIDFRLKNPNYPDAAFPEAQEWFMRKQYERTVQVLAPQLYREPRFQPNAFRILAHAYRHLERYDESIAVWEAYIEFAPDDEPARLNRQRVIDLKAAAEGD